MSQQRNVNQREGEGLEETRHELCPASKAALDALVDACFDHNALDPEKHSRAHLLGYVLQHLRTTPVPGADPAELVARCMGRIKEHGATPVQIDYRLSELDAEALDVLTSVGWDARRVPGAMRARAVRQGELMGLLNASSVIDADSREARVTATLGRVQQAISADAGRMRIHEPMARGRGWRLREVAAVAAMLAIGTMLVWPALSAARVRAQETACSSRLHGMGAAIGEYGNDYKQSLPMATASLAGNLWWNVGNPEQSNSANYFTLRRAKYTNLEGMACVANGAAKSCELPEDARDWSRNEQVSYSFQNLFAHQRTTLDAPGRWAVAADRSPVVQRALRGERTIYVNENSFNHRGEGQNVIYNDGSASWLKTPVMVTGDNLWLPRSIEDLVKKAAERGGAWQSLRGMEEPSGRDDSFLCP
jgi:hypothetical protein